MKILLFGRNGQVGWELQRSLAPLGEVVALDRAGADGLCGDLMDAEGVARTVRAVRPDAVVNAAAYTAVDKAESEGDRAAQVNAVTPGAMAHAAAEVGAWLVHYSTDYVFDGGGTRPWREDDPTGPLSVYGRTKLAGEQRIVAANPKHLVLRTSWVYAARGGNFARTMLRLAGERERLTVIDDQIGAPTGADLLADVTVHALRATLADPRLAGTYHAVAAGETSWHGYASFVIEWARARGQTIKVAPQAIEPVPTTAFPTPAKRPLNSRLSCDKLNHAFGLRLPVWQTGVERMLTEILA